jgi:hypothetical protein
MTLTMPSLPTNPHRLPTISQLRLMRLSMASRWRRSLPVIADIAPEEADAHWRKHVLSNREIVTIEGSEYARAKDGTYQPVGASPYKGLRTIAAGEVLGLPKTHSTIESAPGMITLTLIQPPRREAATIRAEVVHSLLATSTDGEFDSVAKKLRANKAEKSLALRVTALRHVDMKIQDDREIRSRVGVTVREIRIK